MPTLSRSQAVVLTLTSLLAPSLTGCGHSDAANSIAAPAKVYKEPTKENLAAFCEQYGISVGTAVSRNEFKRICYGIFDETFGFDTYEQNKTTSLREVARGALIARLVESIEPPKWKSESKQFERIGTYNEAWELTPVFRALIAEAQGLTVAQDPMVQNTLLVAYRPLVKHLVELLSANYHSIPKILSEIAIVAQKQSISPSLFMPEFYGKNVLEIFITALKPKTVRTFDGMLYGIPGAKFTPKQIQAIQLAEPVAQAALAFIDRKGERPILDEEFASLRRVYLATLQDKTQRDFAAGILSDFIESHPTRIVATPWKNRIYEQREWSQYLISALTCHLAFAIAANPEITSFRLRVDEPEILITDQIRLALTETIEAAKNVSQRARVLLAQGCSEDRLGWELSQILRDSNYFSASEHPVKVWAWIIGNALQANKSAMFPSPGKLVHLDVESLPQEKRAEIKANREIQAFLEKSLGQKPLTESSFKEKVREICTRLKLPAASKDKSWFDSATEIFKLEFAEGISQRYVVAAKISQGASERRVIAPETGPEREDIAEYQKVFAR